MLSQCLSNESPLFYLDMAVCQKQDQFYQLPENENVDHLGCCSYGFWNLS